jgi:hypothetical protein
MSNERRHKKWFTRFSRSIITTTKTFYALHVAHTHARKSAVKWQFEVGTTYQSKKNKREVNQCGETNQISDWNLSLEEKRKKKRKLMSIS